MGGRHKVKKISYITDYSTWRSEFIFSKEINIRFSETDMFGHVNNTSAFIYLEEARIEYLKKCQLYLEIKNNKTIPVVVDLQCDFLHQIFFGEKITVFVKVDSVGTTSFDLHYLAENEKGDVCLIGRGRLVNFDVSVGKPLALTADEIKKLS